MKTYISILATLICIGVFGQSTNSVPTNIRAEHTLDRLSDGGLGLGENLIGIPVPPGEVIGDTYLNENWRKTTLMLFGTDKLAEGYMCRYNIQSNQIEMKSSNAVSAIPGSKVRSFVWIDADSGDPTYFINAKEYTVKSVAQIGFLEVLVDGSLPLFKKTTIVVRQPDYKPELHMGSRDTQIIKKETYYSADKTELVEIKKNKKKFLEIFGADASEVDNFIKINSLNIDSELNCVRIFDYYNKNFKK